MTNAMNHTPDTFTPKLIDHLHKTMQRVKRRYGSDANDYVHSSIVIGHRPTIFALWGAYLHSHRDDVDHCRLSWDAGDTAPDVIATTASTKSWVQWLEQSGFIQGDDRRTMLHWMDNMQAVHERRN